MVGSRTEKGTKRFIREKADCKLWFEVHCLFIYFIYLFIYLSQSMVKGRRII